MMVLKSYLLGYLIVMMALYSSVALKVFPTFQFYNNMTEFASLICSNDDNSFVSGDDIEWLYSNFTLMISTTDYRIDVYGDSVIFTPPLLSDAGSYWCRNRTNHRDMAEGKLLFKDVLTTVHEKETTLRGFDIQINCLVDVSVERGSNISWVWHGLNLGLISETLKYTINTTELIIHNVTVDDEGEYACYSEEIAIVYTVIDIIVTWSPELISEQDQTAEVSVGEEVILNCTVSASPDPVYTWSFPDSCSSCPNTSNDSVFIFTAEDVTDSGEYTCVAKNQYRNLSVTFYVWIAMKPIMATNFTTIRKDQSMGNVMLTCPVNYSYPTAVLTWNIMTESSSGYDVVEENSTGNYVLLNNGSLEVYRRFIYEEDHVTVKCLATNEYGSAKSVFNIWDDAQVKYFILYVKTPSCENISNNSKELYQVLREWFNSVCNCDGFNNLYRHQVTCVDATVVNVTSEVHSEDNSDKTAELLIDLAKSDIEKRNPPQVKISDWILCLSERCDLSTKELSLYIKNVRCRNDNAEFLMNVVQGFVKFVCNCNTNKHSVICLDNTTVNITIVFQSQKNYTAQIMSDSIVHYIQAQDHVVYLQAGWAVCLDPECEYNSTTTIDKSDDDNFIPQTVGLVVGTVLCVVIITSLSCICLIVKRTNSISRKSNDLNAKPDDHIYDELDMYAKTAISAKTPSPKSDNVIFDTEEVEPPGYQSLPAPRYESCSATSIAKSNHSNDYIYHIKEDTRSIKEETCEYALEKTTEQLEEASKHHEPYCKLYHFNNNSCSI